MFQFLRTEIPNHARLFMIDGKWDLIQLRTNNKIEGDQNTFMWTTKKTKPKSGSSVTEKKYFVSRFCFVFYFGAKRLAHPPPPPPSFLARSYCEVETTRVSCSYVRHSENYYTACNFLKGKPSNDHKKMMQTSLNQMSWRFCVFRMFKLCEITAASHANTVHVQMEFTY